MNATMELHFPKLYLTHSEPKNLILRKQNNGVNTLKALSCKTNRVHIVQVIVLIKRCPF